MGDSETRAKRTRPIFPRPGKDSRYEPLAGEREVLEQIVLGAPLPQTLNKICTMIDDAIVNVVAMISLPQEDERYIYVGPETAAQVGLKLFSSVAILSRNDILLGTLEIYGCDSRLPTPSEVRFIERAAHLGAVALQRHKEIEAHERSSGRSRGVLDGIALARGPFIN